MLYLPDCGKIYQCSDILFRNEAEAGGLVAIRAEHGRKLTAA